MMENTGQKGEKMEQCIWCGAKGDWDPRGVDVFDDARWRSIQDQHDPRCSWAVSRGFKHPTGR